MLVDDTRCAFCGTGSDSLAHISRCPTVLLAYDDIRQSAMLPFLVDGRQVLMLQDDLDGSTVTGVVAFFAAIWNVRSFCRRGGRYNDHAELLVLILTTLKCSWLTGCCPSKGRKERRADRAREPRPLPNVVIYRSDGASRGQGSADESAAGWGSAVWAATPAGLALGPPAASARNFLGYNVSNNIAEYRGLIECMRRAVRRLDAEIIFDVDSMLLAKQLARYHPWACRSQDLLPLHEECVRLGAGLDASNVRWEIRHIYREFNQAADALSNQAIDERESNGPSDEW